MEKSFKDRIKSGIALVTTLCIILGLGGCGKKDTDTKESSQIVSSYNNEFKTSEIPAISVEEAKKIEFNTKITYYDIVKIIEDVSKKSESEEISLDKCLKGLKADEAYNEYIIARKDGKDIRKIRKALGEFEERVLKAFILKHYNINPEKVESMEIKYDFWNNADRSGENYEGQIITIEYKEYKKISTKPGGIVEEDIVKPKKETIELSILRKQLKRIDKLKDGQKYDLEEIDDIMKEVLIGLCYDPKIEYFDPTPWGYKQFDYLVYEINEEVYTKVKALSSVLEKTETKAETSKETKAQQLSELKRQAEFVKTAMRTQNQSLKYTNNVSKSIPRRI